ncbi:MAG TPA: transglutaminase family protein [Aeromicrobium sp.]|nr:transglutaminase family protein [Aeromicrobium sp.]
MTESMQLRIRHTTGYDYDAGATGSFNEARMTPQNTSDQFVLRSRLEIKPTPWTLEYTDYWGTTVTAFQVQEPHHELSVVAQSIVETRSTSATGRGVAWSDLPGVADEHCEFLALNDWVRPAESLLAEVDAVRAAATPIDYAHDVMALVHDRVRYVPGSTEVTTSAAAAWDNGSGVCQDIAHISIGALRHAGIPARYVSGYLHPSKDPQVDEPVEGESHAWVEVWDGDWVGFDPTNQIPQGTRHVVVARARDYDDCPPLRGIYSTTGGSDLFVGVEITRV